jgi:hypothetical protein
MFDADFSLENGWPSAPAWEDCQMIPDKALYGTGITLERFGMKPAVSDREAGASGSV